MNHSAEKPDDRDVTPGMTSRPADQATEPGSDGGAQDAAGESERSRSNGSRSGKFEVTRLLRMLAAQCRDSEAGYRQAYEKADDRSLRMEFGQLVDEREDMGKELDRCLEQVGETPAESGTTLGAAHRIFLDLKVAIMGRDREVIFREVARGEGVFEATYDAALKADLPPDVRKIISEQHRRVRESRDRFRARLPSPAHEHRGSVTTIGSVTGAIEKNPTVSCALLAAAATGFAAALWMTRHSARR